MARWAWIVCDTAGVAISDLVQATDRKITWAVDGPCTASWTTRGDDPGAIAALELETDLTIYRDSDLMFRGRIGSSGDSGDANRHTIQWSAVDYRGMLGRREIWPGSTTTYTGVEQATIAWDLIQDAQAVSGGDLGITNSATPTGITRTRTFEVGKWVADAINDVGNADNGFDWDISANLEFRLWPTARGSTKDWGAVFGDSITAFRRVLDASTFATDIYATGATGTTPVTRSVGSHGAAGRWDATVSWPDVSDAGTLGEYADAALTEMSTIRPSYQLTVRQGAWAPADAWLGDTTTIGIRSGRLNVNTTGRIMQIDIALDGDGGETVTLSYDRRPVTLADRLRNVNDKLATLSRT